jgi:hypothetical protein
VEFPFNVQAVFPLRTETSYAQMANIHLKETVTTILSLTYIGVKGKVAPVLNQAPRHPQGKSLWYPLNIG